MAEEGVDDLLEYDGLFNENAPRFKKTRTVVVMTALDHTGSSDYVQLEVDGARLEEDGRLPKFGDGIDRTPTFGEGTDFAAVEPDVAEAESFGGMPTPAETREIVSDGRATLACWRRDDFSVD